MNVKDFAVTVQWGKGMHYFVTTELTSRPDAEALAARLRALHKKHQKQKGAKPTVYVWKKCAV